MTTIDEQSLNTLNEKENRNYEKNEVVTKSTGVHLKKLEQRYETEERERYRRKTPGTAIPWLLKNTNICYDIKSPNNNENKKSSI